VISDVVEIVYTNDLNEKKLALLSDRARVSVYRVDAQWVLRQTGEPQEFPEKSFRRVASFNKRTEEILKGWLLAGRPENGTLWDGIAAAMVLTLFAVSVLETN
jgi:hypothetical protein